MAGFDKRVQSYSQALEGLVDGMTVIAGGFGLCGVPENLIAQIRTMGVRNLTVVSNNCGVDEIRPWRAAERPADPANDRLVCGREHALFEKQLLSGELEVQLTPQGTLAEKLRAGGAGIPAFYTAPGVGTPVAEREGRTHLRGPSVHPRRVDHGRLRDHQGLEGGLVRKHRLPAYRAELQSPSRPRRVA